MGKVASDLAHDPDPRDSSPNVWKIHFDPQSSDAPVLVRPLRLGEYHEVLDTVPSDRVQHFLLAPQALLVSIHQGRCYHHFILDKGRGIWTTALLFETLLKCSMRELRPEEPENGVKWEVVCTPEGSLEVYQSNRITVDKTPTLSITLTQTATLVFLDGEGGVIIDIDRRGQWSPQKLLQHLEPFQSCRVVANPALSADTDANRTAPDGNVVSADQKSVLAREAGRRLGELIRNEVGVAELIAEYLRTHPRVPRGRRPGTSLALRGVHSELAEAFRCHFRTRYRLLGTPDDLAAFQKAHREYSGIQHVVIDVIPVTWDAKFWHSLLRDVVANMQSVMLRGVLSGGSRSLRFPEGITLVDLMTSVHSSVSVYGLHMEYSDLGDWTQLPGSGSWDELVLSHVTMPVQMFDNFGDMWRRLLRARGVLTISNGAGSDNNTHREAT